MQVDEINGFLLSPNQPQPSGGVLKEFSNSFKSPRLNAMIDVDEIMTMIDKPENAISKDPAFVPLTVQTTGLGL